MKLTAFNFIISHRLSKTNSADALSKHSDYKSVGEVNEIMKTLLSTLQQKLAILAAVFSSKFAPLIGQVISGVRAAEIKVSELSYKHLRSACVTHTQHICCYNNNSE